MRTSLTVGDELNERLVQTARATGQPFKVVVNLDYQPHAGKLRPGIDPYGFNELAGDLDDRCFAARQKAAKNGR